MLMKCYSIDLFDCVASLVFSLSVQFQSPIDLRSAIDPCCCEPYFKHRRLYLRLQRTPFLPYFPLATFRDRALPREAPHPAGALRCGERRSPPRGRLPRLGAGLAPPRLSSRGRRENALHSGSSVLIFAIQPGTFYNGSSPLQQFIYIE